MNSKTHQRKQQLNKLMNSKTYHLKQQLRNL